MKNLVLLLIIMLSAACSKKHGGMQFTPPNTVPSGSQMIHVVYDRTSPIFTGAIYQSHEFDMNSLFTTVFVTNGLVIDQLGYTDIGGCLVARGVTGVMYSVENNKFSFYFVRNDQAISYADLWGCEIDLNIGVRQ